MTKREPLRIRRLFEIPADHFWCRRCEAWLNPAFFEREHPRRNAAAGHPMRSDRDEQLGGAVPSLYRLNRRTGA